MKLTKLIDSGIPILSGVLLILLVIVTFLQIILREFLDFSLNWSDEIAQFCMMWMVLLGSIWLTKHDQHISTGFKLYQNLNKKLVGLVDGILALVTVSSTAVVAYQSAIFAYLAMNISSLSLPWIKMGYVYLLLPLFMLTMCYYYLKSFFKNLSLLVKKD
jgi:TRAP-type C4-dicarboxylate transport system permease small subunit